MFALKSKGRVLLTGILLSLVVFMAPNNYTSSDSRGALLTSQSILAGHKGDLAPYGDAGNGLGYRVGVRDSRLVYAFPIGSSVMALPIVAVASAMGVDLQRPNEDTSLQMLLSAIVVFLLYLLMVELLSGLGRWSELAAFGVVAGSPLVSTIGTAYWSVGPALVLMLASICLVERSRHSQQYRTAAAIVLPLLLAASWVTRPTMALPGVVLAAVYFLISPRERGRFLTWSLIAGLGTLLCLRVFQGALLPEYYSSSRVTGILNVKAALGHLLSPSRGLFVYCPQVLIIVLAVAAMKRNIHNAIICGAGLAWFAGHWIAVSRFEHWWGGHGFGPRLMLEAYVACVVIVALLEYRTVSRVLKTAILVVAFASLTFATFVHSYRGLFEFGTTEWNSQPVSVDARPQKIWEWQDAQFLATASKYDRQRFDRALGNLQAPEDSLFHDANSPHLAVLGFRSPHVHDGRPYRWGYVESMEIDLALPQAVSEASTPPPLHVTLSLGSLGPVDLQVLHRGVVLATVALNGFSPVPVELVLDSYDLERAPNGQVDLLRFELVATKGGSSRPMFAPLWKAHNLTVSIWGFSVRSG